MFCSNCGTQLPDNAQFCPKCGCKVFRSESAAWQENTTQRGNPPQPVVPPVIKPRPKWLIPVIVGTVALFFVLAVAIIATVFLGRSAPSTTEIPVSSTVETPVTGIQRYENSATRFALEYPSDFTYSEPDSNNVLFSLGDQCRVVAEYAFVTTRNCFIYSAEDFAEQLNGDPTLLAEWVGTEAVETSGFSEEKIAGKDCYHFAWELTQDGASYEGGLYLFDSEGEFGCYTFLWMLEEGASNREQRMEQIEQMLESFEIIGEYQAEGYTLYSSDAPDHLEFILRDEAVQGEIKLGYEGEILTNYVQICAAEQGQSTVSMYEDDHSQVSADSGSDEFASVMQTALNAYAKSDDVRNFQIFSELSRLDMGRYPFVQVGMSFTYQGFGLNQDETCYKVFFPCGGSYWIIELRAVEENLEQTAAVLSDFLMSLRVEEGGIETGEDAYGSLSQATGNTQGAGTTANQSSDKNQMVEEILSQLENSSDFLPPSQSYQPLASVTDINGNGVNEMVLLYKTKDYRVKYQVWSLFADGYDLLKEDELFAEVGGNSGSIDLALDENQIPYLVLEVRSPQGDSFHNTYTYLPWNHEQTGFSDYEAVVLESTGIYGEEENGTYYLAGTKVDKNIFDGWRADFTHNWTALNLVAGPGNGGNNMSFEHLRMMDANTELNH